MRIIDLQTLSLSGGSGIAETKIPLWWADGSSGAGTGATTAGSAFLTDGSVTPNGSGSSVKLFTLSSTFSSTIQFALEYTGLSSSGYTVWCEMWDFTTSTPISASDVGVVATSMTVTRSGKFTLTPGHSYGITTWNNGGSGSVCDASLIVFPQ